MDTDGRRGSLSGLGVGRRKGGGQVLLVVQVVWFVVVWKRLTSHEMFEFIVELELELEHRRKKGCM